MLSDHKMLKASFSSVAKACRGRQGYRNGLQPTEVRIQKSKPSAANTLGKPTSLEPFEPMNRHDMTWMTHIPVWIEELFHIVFTQSWLARFLREILWQLGCHKSPYACHLICLPSNFLHELLAATSCNSSSSTFTPPQLPKPKTDMIQT